MDLKKVAEVIAWWKGHISSNEKLTIVDESIITSVLTDKGPMLHLEKPVTLTPGDYEVCINQADGKVTFFRIEEKSPLHLR